MIRNLIIVFVACLSFSCFAQEGTASPYSFYGIGSLKLKGTVENRSMGGLSIYADSIHVNLRNPAAFTGNNLASLNNESRPVRYTVGGSYVSEQLKNENSGTTDASTASFDYLALTLPVGKFGVGFGLLPYTAVGYQLETQREDGLTTNQFRGQGGLNKAFLGAAYQITEDLSFGFNVQYNFGNIQNSALAFRFDEDDIPLLTQSRENNRSDLSGLNVDFGLSYKTMITESLELVSGITYTPESNITSKNERTFSTVAIATTGQEIVRNTLTSNLEAQGLAETDLVLPAKFSFGAGIGKPRKWFVGAEYESQQISNFENVLYQTSVTTYEDAYRFSLGGFYIPEYNAFSGFFKRIVYRAGLRFEKTGLIIQGEPIDEFGISFGVGVPVGEFFSNVNLGAEIGRRGTTNNNLIQENYINFQISLSLNDRWFQKRKYD